MPKSRKYNSNRRSSVRKKESKGGGSFFKRLFAKFSVWSVLLGVCAIMALYGFILFYFFIDTSSFSWHSSFSNENYPPDYTVRGIDVSHYQGNIDWSVLRNANMGSDPVSFVIIKATEGEKIMDECFNDNFYQARRNGILRGAYHFLLPDVSAKKQARFFLRQAHLEEGDLPPVLDIEDEARWLAAGKNKRQIQKMALEWLDIVEEHYKVSPIIYSSYQFRRDILSDKRFDKYPFWIAHYFVDSPTGDLPWMFWQHTDNGRVDGIEGSVDCNVFSGNIDELKNILIK